MPSSILPFRQPPSRQETLARVHGIATNTSRILWSEHARERMDEREISAREALVAIREGQIDGRIVPDGDDGWKATLRRRHAGRTVRVGVAISDDDDLVVITVM